MGQGEDERLCEEEITHKATQKKTAALIRERPFGVFQQVKRLFAFLGFLLLFKVFLQSGQDFEVAEGAVLNVVIDFLHSTLGLFGCLFSGIDAADDQT